MSSEQRSNLLHFEKMNANLKTIEVCVECALTLDVCDQTHYQLFIILVPDVHQSGDVQRQTIYT